MRILIALLVMVGTAHATHPGSSSTYALAGFTDDSKHVYFTKTNSFIMDTEEWLAVYDASTLKLKKSVPVFRECPSEDCTAIARKVGDKTVAKLHASYTAPNAKTIAAAKAKIEEKAAKAAVVKGLDQEFSAPNAQVKTTTKILGKLEDPNSDPGASAPFEVAVTVTANGGTYTGKTKLRVQTIDDIDNGNLQHWPLLAVQELAVAPDLRAVAIVFGRKPH